MTPEQEEFIEYINGMGELDLYYEAGAGPHEELGRATSKLVRWLFTEFAKRS